MAEQIEMPTTGHLAEWLRYIEVIFSQLTVNEAIDILLELGFERALFRADDDELYHLINLHDIEEIQDDEACQYPLYFVGGPPDAESKWYHGTLVTWVVDALLHNLAVTDGSKAMLVIQNVEDIWNEGDEFETRWEYASG